MDSRTEDTAAEGLDLIWGAKAIGECIGRSERQTFYLLESGQLPARRVGNKWVASRAALYRSLVSEAA